MSEYQRCRTCKTWGFSNSHVCPPIWEARIYETKWQEEWREIYATDAEEAAEKFAEEYDCGGDYDIVRRGSAEIEVRKLGDQTAVIVDISAETVPSYNGYIREARP